MKETDDVEWITVGEFENRYDLPHGIILDRNGRAYRRDKIIGIRPSEGNGLGAVEVVAYGRKKPARKEESE